MSNFTAGLLSFLILLLLLALRVPIGVAMMAVGAGGFIWIQGLGAIARPPHARLTHRQCTLTREGGRSV